MKKISKFFRYPLATKFLVIEAFLYSIWFEICIYFNIHKQTNALKLNKNISLQSENDNKDVLLGVRRAVKIVEKFSPWKPKCHNLALTAMSLLRKRDIESSMHVGFKKDKNNQLEGHAWLTHQGKLIIGDIKGGIQDFKELT